MTDQIPQPKDAITYDLSLLEQSRRAWLRSSALRMFYGDLCREVLHWHRPGATLEIGSGIGVAKEFIPDVVTSDIVRTAYVDCEMSAYGIRAHESGPWANIFSVDVFHHLTAPLKFLESAAAVLQPGGRVILVEPAATWGGSNFYRLFHREPIILNEVRAPFEFDANGENGEFANMAMAEGLFRVHRSIVEAELSAFGLVIEHIHYRDLLAYPLTGGFSSPQMLPRLLIRAILWVEKRLPRAWFKYLGLRMVIVLRKRSGGSGESGELSSREAGSGVT